jgi:CheY-like chemotaxis protein
LDNVGKGRAMGTSETSRPVVLIVEDEFLLRMNAAEMIGEAGFDVVEAANADEAIAILEARPDIHVIFTDIQMPGSMDGMKFARFVRGRWPPIKIVATSGFVNVGKDDLPEGSRFLTKPYRPAQIVATLREYAAIPPITECRTRDPGGVAAHGIGQSDPPVFASWRLSRRDWWRRQAFRSLTAGIRWPASDIDCC